jgi:hypothetical protein
MSNENESMDRLEKRLKGCCPSPVSPALMNQLRTCMPQQKVAQRRPFRFYKALMAIAATVILGFGVTLWSLNITGVQKGLHIVDHPAGRLTVKSSDNYFVGVRNVGIWSAPDGRAYKVVQGVSLNQTVVQNSDNGSELKMIEPQQQVLLVAMATQ